MSTKEAGKVEDTSAEFVGKVNHAVVDNNSPSEEIETLKQEQDDGGLKSEEKEGLCHDEPSYYYSDESYFASGSSQKTEIEKKFDSDPDVAVAKLLLSTSLVGVCETRALKKRRQIIYGETEDDNGSESTDSEANPDGLSPMGRHLQKKKCRRGNGGGGSSAPTS